MKKVSVLVLTMLLLSSASVFAKDHFYDVIEKLKGSNIEVVITESNKTETGILTDYYLGASPEFNFLNCIFLTNDKGEQVYIPAREIKSLKVVTGVKPGSKK